MSTPEIELRMNMDPQSRDIYIDGAFFGYFRWHDNEWNIMPGTWDPLPWSLIEKCVEFRRQHMEQARDRQRVQQPDEG